MDSLTTPLKHMVRYSLGTITFASLIVTLVNIVKVILLLARCKDCRHDSCICCQFFGRCIEFVACACTGAF